MLNRLKTFIKEEDGAVTVDWVVLTAAIAGMVVLISTFMGNSVLVLTGGIASFLIDWSPL